MKLTVIYTAVLIFAAASVYLIGIKPYVQPTPSVVLSPTLPNIPGNTAIQLTDERPVALATRDVYKGSNIIFSCKYIPQTDSGCDLYVSDASGGNATDLRLGDYGVFPSPDGAHVVVLTPTQVILFDSATLASTSLTRAPVGEEFGFWSGFPTFQPRAKWLDSTHIELSLYKKDTIDEYSQKPDGTYDTTDPPRLTTTIVGIVK